MSAYRCTNCGYDGDSFVFQCNDYGYCVASNDTEPEYVESSPEWVNAMGFGEIEIEEPVGCPNCRIWGVAHFERTD